MSIESASGCRAIKKGSSALSFSCSTLFSFALGGRGAFGSLSVVRTVVGKHGLRF